VLTVLQAVRDYLDAWQILDPANTNNVISEQHTADEKKKIMAQAKASLEQKYWEQVIWEWRRRRPRRRSKRTFFGIFYGALEDQVRTQLEVRRLAHKNAEARGDAAEEVWLDLLASHLPSRYRAGKGIIIDSNGKESDYIDIIVYDRHFTPPVFSDLYIPAESVYAVIEAKQELSRTNIIYAGKKAQSVRRLYRTNGASPSSRSSRSSRHVV
jgi:hypothetical protein